ncbi:MAG: cyclic nucleotide-binding domain-containing protein [Chloroflexi bacterium]|nr:cyclic nucleotide-binding domain-containing protein [Chloroflexota bacterium]
MIDKPVATHRIKAEELRLLERIAIFRDLTEDQLHKMLGVMSRRHSPPGEIIVQEGDLGETMFVLVNGTVEVSKSLTLRLSDGDFGSGEKTLLRLSANDGAFFGEMAMLESSERSATVSALTECEMLELSKDDFAALCSNEPELGFRVLSNIVRVLSARLRKANSDVLKLTTALSIALSNR